MAKKAASKRPNQPKRRAEPSETAVQLAELKRDKARLREIKRLTRLITAHSDALRIGEFQRARDICSQQGFAVVANNYLAELRQQHEDMKRRLAIIDAPNADSVRETVGA